VILERFECSSFSSVACGGGRKVGNQLIVNVDTGHGFLGTVKASLSSVTGAEVETSMR
jgi:hypothetical protein